MYLKAISDECGTEMARATHSNTMGPKLYFCLSLSTDLSRQTIQLS